MCRSDPVVGGFDSHILPPTYSEKPSRDYSLEGFSFYCSLLPGSMGRLPRPQPCDSLTHHIDVLLRLLDVLFEQLVPAEKALGALTHPVMLVVDPPQR
jgi:hypothetical protein